MSHSPSTRVFELTLANRRVRWALDGLTVRRVAMSPERAFVVGHASDRHWSYEVVAIDREDGRVLWRLPLENASYTHELSNDVLYLGRFEFRAARVHVSGLDSETGRELFATDFPIPIEGNTGRSFGIVPLENRALVVAGVGPSAAAVMLE